MISCIITSYREPRTIGVAIEAFLEQDFPETYEIIVCAPDEETLEVARRYQKKSKSIRVLKDPGRGKPTALNYCFQKARGEILVLSDGDVSIGKGSIGKIIPLFNQKEVGAVTGRVYATNNRNTLLGFWAHILTEGFHLSRMKAESKKRFLLCTGYLYAVRKNLVPVIPPETLADDAFISHSVAEHKKEIHYAPSAHVYVRYPTNLPDWIRQKKRTAGRLYQLGNRFKVSKIDSLFEEVFISLQLLRDIRSVKEFMWYGFLLAMKLYIWARTLFDIRLWKRSLKQVWERVESTK